MAEQNELLVTKTDAFMKRWIWWLIVPMALWLIIGIIIRGVL